MVPNHNITNERKRLNPDLKAEIIHSIFEYHSTYLEKAPSLLPNDITLSHMNKLMNHEEASIQMAFGTSIDGIGNIMQHNPNQADAEDLPPEILEKIGAIAKIISPTDEFLMPKAVHGCNCFFCQIARTLHPDSSHISDPSLTFADEEAIDTEKELKFQEWDVQETGNKLYSVLNRLDHHEVYQVYLGEPIGCTCGKQRCEHILAVLKS